jgi:hypothetical protein
LLAAVAGVATAAAVELADIEHPQVLLVAELRLSRHLRFHLQQTTQ